MVVMGGIDGVRWKRRTAFMLSIDQNSKTTEVRA
jgi:hypothetical protein